jgi:serine/threonine protein kinase
MVCCGTFLRQDHLKPFRERDNMRERREQFVDENDYVHVLGEKIGQGGQGVVYRTSDADVAVKIFTDDNGRWVTDKDHVERFHRRLELVSTLPIPSQTPLAKPVAKLNDVAGYVMRLLEDMNSFSTFWPDNNCIDKTSETKLPKWLSSASNEQAAPIIHYRDTGGLRLRLRGLFKCAAILSRLHGRGLVYGDLSPANVFISSKSNSDEVWLIDTENLRFETQDRGQTTYTPGFGAPELVRGDDGGRPRTDCHAFAVMAFKTLALVHPFMGNYVQSASEVDWADDDFDQEDLDQKAHAGEIPWIEDREDDINHSSDGLPRPLVLTKELRSLFQETFGPGRTMPWRRPSIFHWPRALARALDQTILCENKDCGMSYYCDLQSRKQRCPYCKQTRPGIVLVAKAFQWGEAGKALSSPCWSLCKECKENEASVLPERLMAPFSMSHSDRPALEIRFSKNTVMVKNICQENNLRFSLVHNTNGDGRFQSFTSATKVRVKDSPEGLYIFVKSDFPRLLHIFLTAEPK